jgi:hypothetical protein|eukprot:COSAG06_NODE_6753_length_2797_cov_2.323202_3_plen_59_part_00
MYYDDLIMTGLITQVLTAGIIDIGKLRPVARLGYSQEYTVIEAAMEAAEPAPWCPKEE